MMVKEDEVLRIAKKLDKMVSKKKTDEALDLLKELKSMAITLELLQSTRIGMSVNALRKQSNDEEVIAISKSLIKSWKKLIDGSEEKGEDKKKSDPPPTSSMASGDSKLHSPNRKQEAPKTPPTPKITTFPQIPVTSDSVRNKCREMLVAALQIDNDYIAIGTDCEHLAAQIED